MSKPGHLRPHLGSSDHTRGPKTAPGVLRPHTMLRHPSLQHGMNHSLKTIHLSGLCRGETPYIRLEELTNETRQHNRRIVNLRSKWQVMKNFLSDRAANRLNRLYQLIEIVQSSNAELSEEQT